MLEETITVNEEISWISIFVLPRSDNYRIVQIKTNKKQVFQLQ